MGSLYLNLLGVRRGVLSCTAASGILKCVKFDVIFFKFDVEFDAFEHHTALLLEEHYVYLVKFNFLTIFQLRLIG